MDTDCLPVNHIGKPHVMGGLALAAIFHLVANLLCIESPLLGRGVWWNMSHNKPFGIIYPKAYVNRLCKTPFPPGTSLNRQWVHKLVQHHDVLFGVPLRIRLRIGIPCEQPIRVVRFCAHLS